MAAHLPADPERSSAHVLTLDEIDTPALVVDLDVVERNIERYAKLARERGIKLRPHIKTHKSPYFAHMQLARGAQGVTVATLYEAEVMANAGITDILLAYPPIGKAKLQRLAALLQRADVKVSLDSFAAAEPLSELAQALGKAIEIYIDVDTGLHRMGLPAGKPSAELGAAVNRLPGLKVVGVMSHCGHIGAGPTEELPAGARQDAEALVETAELMRAAGVDVREVSPGSTTGTPYAVEVKGVTEVRPGTYIFNDINTVVNGIVPVSECAVSVLTTVVSVHPGDRAVIDAGSKTLSSDRCPKREGFGLIKGWPELIIRSLSEEHGVITLGPGEAPFAVGDKIQVIPNHVCVAVNLAETMILVRGDRVVGKLPVAARGRGV